MVTTHLHFNLAKSHFSSSEFPRYKSAARQFLEASLDHCECPDLMSPNNVAIYGGLTALATFDRTELLKQVDGSCCSHKLAFR